MNGTALIKNWIVVDANSSYLFPEIVGNGTSSVNGTPSASGKPSQYTGGASSLNAVGGAILVVVVSIFITI
jgi:hypothetical protein